MKNKDYKSLRETFILLEDGMVFKSFPDLCRFLHQPITNGNSRQAQFKEFEQYFEFEKIEGTNKIEIKHVYYEPTYVTNVISSKGNNNVYGELVQKLLMDTLATAKLTYNTNVIYKTKTELALESGFINSSYINYRDNHSDLSKILLVNKWNIEEHYRTVFNKAMDAVNNGLKVLYNASALQYNPDTIMVYGRDGEFEKSSEASSQEISEILWCEDMAMNIITKRMKKLYKIKKSKLDKNDIVMYGQTKLFFKLVDKIIKRFYKRGFIKFNGKYYRVVKIVLSENFIQQRDRLSRYLLKERKDVVAELNNVFYQRNIDSYKRLHDKALNELDKLDGMDTFKSTRIKNRAKETFISQGFALVDFTVKI